MTLIIGVLCEGGVVVAADRQVTSAIFLPLANPQPLQMQTSTSATTKVTIIERDTLLGISGTPAIADTYEASINSHHQRFTGGLYTNATRKLQEEIRGAILEHVKVAKELVGLIGQMHAYSQAVCECLLAAPFRDGVKLIQILQHGAFDVAKSELPIRVIGSGQIHADPFMVFLRNTFWPDRLPTVQEGILASCWAIDYAIEVGAPQVGRDIDAFTLSANERGRFRAVKVPEEQIKNHREFISAGRERLRDLANLHHSTQADIVQVPTLKA
jgi:hypothetical protein